MFSLISLDAYISLRMRRTGLMQFTYLITHMYLVTNIYETLLVVSFKFPLVLLGRLSDPATTDFHSDFNLFLLTRNITMFLLTRNKAT